MIKGTCDLVNGGLSTYKMIVDLVEVNLRFYFVTWHHMTI